jgi:hypothetical protein
MDNVVLASAFKDMKGQLVSGAPATVTDMANVKLLTLYIKILSPI